MSRTSKRRNRAKKKKSGKKAPSAQQVITYQIDMRQHILDYFAANPVDGQRVVAYRDGSGYLEAIDWNDKATFTEQMQEQLQVIKQDFLFSISATLLEEVETNPEAVCEIWRILP